MVAPIVVWGQKILMLNLSASPTLVLEDNPPNCENLVWFLEELQKDTVRSEGQHRDLAAKKTIDTRCNEEQGILEEALTQLRQHVNCKQAWFLESRKAISVTTKRGKRHQ